jgi:putative hydroxymethylpyrimidine transport system permease protein
MGLALSMSFLPPARSILLPVMCEPGAAGLRHRALLALWFGFGLASKVVMATIAIFFPVASAYHDGLSRTDPGLIDLARLNRSGRMREVAYLRIPAALPALITGIRLAAVYAPIGALIGEWVGASSGLGYAMLLAQGRSQTAVVFACLLSPCRDVDPPPRRGRLRHPQPRALGARISLTNPPDDP